MTNREKHHRLSEMEEANKRLEKMCEMLDPEFFNKVRENSMDKDGVSSLEFIHNNMQNWLKAKKG